MSLHARPYQHEPIERDPMFTAWARPLPRLWYLDQRQATRIDAESLYGSTLYAAFYGRTADESLATPTDTATAAVVGYYREITEAIPIAPDVADRTVAYTRSATDSLAEPVDQGIVVKGGSGAIQPPVHVMVPGDVAADES